MKKIKAFILMMLVVGLVFAQEEKDVEIEMSTSEISYEDAVETSCENPEKRIKQGVQNRANKFYNKLGYMASADIYQHLIDEESQEINLLANIANSYRLNGITDQAEYWYSRFIHLTQKPEYYLQYAEVLKSNGNCKAAAIWFNKYKTMVNETLDVEAINDCSEIQFFKKYNKIEIELAKGLNSESLDFCAMPYKEGVVFTSSREMKRPFKTKDFWTNKPFTDLFYAELDADGGFKKPQLIKGNINTKTHDGVASFDKTGSKMIFTRNDKKGKKNLQVFIARKGPDDYWFNAKKMTFNSSEYSSCHGSLSQDNSKIYFSSNRPGGLGGFDLYVSEYINGQWGDAKNLGAEVNSSGNEIFPFIAEDGVLYYSSDGHKGLGGLDVFMSKIEGEIWQKPEHLGSPINSSKDDFGFYIDKEKEKGYISSNRGDGGGRDNIYTLKVNGEWPFDRGFYKIDISVFEKGLDFPLSGINVKVIEKLSKPHTNVSHVESFLVTGEDDNFNFLAKRNMTYLFEIEKEGYKSLKRYVTTKKLRNDATFDLDVVE